MKKRLPLFISTITIFSILSSCTDRPEAGGTEQADKDSTRTKMSENSFVKNGYSEVNGIKMYYEIYGKGKPLVLIHGGGSTIETSFGRIIPLLAKDRQIIAMELQAHGRTADRDKPLSFEQDADDVAALLSNLKIAKADILGFSNGGQTAIELSLRHPGLIDKLILASAFYKRDAVFAGFWDIFKNADVKDMPEPLKQGFLEVNNDPSALVKMFNRDVERMQNFKGWSDEQIQSIKASTLIVSGTKDVATVEHAAEMHRLIPNSELAILPGGHGQYLGEVTTLVNGQWEYPYAVGLIEEFLNSSK